MYKKFCHNSVKYKDLERTDTKFTMKQFFKKIEAIITGKINHLNNVCFPVAANLWKNIEKLPMPYSLLYYWLMVQAYGEFSYNFTRGIFSNTIKNLDGKLTRKVFGVYLCYSVWLFKQIQGYKDLNKKFSNFNKEELDSILFNLTPYAKEAKKRIKKSENSGGNPIVGLPFAIDEAIKGESISIDEGKKKNNLYLFYGIEYMENMKITIEDFANDLARGKTGKFE